MTHCGTTKKHKITKYFDGRLTYNQTNDLVRLEGRELNLSPTEMVLFEYLSSHQGITRSDTTILEHLISIGGYGTEASLRVHIGNMRHKMGNGWGNMYSGVIQTEQDVGYRFAKEVDIN